jgi:glyoxylase-like metal-dependent hydrolase (beta-lactamase superfamily II)
MTIKQIKVGFDNFSYVIYCQKTRKAAIVDPSYDASNVIEFISSNNLTLMYIINTHYHSDHTSENNRVKRYFSTAELIASKADGEKLGIKVDKYVYNKDQLSLGNITLTILLTPGHTTGGICIIVDNEALLTGDTLFIGDCGRTDLPGGNLVQMYKTLNEKIMYLPDHLIVYPGHDYGEKPFDTLGNQKQINKTLLAKNFEEFSKIP